MRRLDAFRVLAGRGYRPLWADCLRKVLSVGDVDGACASLVERSRTVSVSFLPAGEVMRAAPLQDRPVGTRVDEVVLSLHLLLRNTLVRLLFNCVVAPRLLLLCR